jgi:3-oxoacyl-[acyl-carrier-protein] synthase II
MARSNSDILITGIGLVSSLGESAAAHVSNFRDDRERRLVDEERYDPYCIHPIAALDYAQQIAKKSDLKQMETWQRIGVHAAGLALSDARIVGNSDLLDRTHLIVAAGSGERDIDVDCDVLSKLSQSEDSTLLAKEVLPSALRPTLFLAQLSNMLAGNISIVHGVTGSSRTFMGEEMAGLAAAQNAWRRIAAGQAEIAVVGGALNADRQDLLLAYELGHNLWRGPYAPVWNRRDAGGGFILGSVGAFLVLESRSHAEARGASAYAKISSVATERCNREPGGVTRAMVALLDELGTISSNAPLPILSGASGVEPVTGEELAFLEDLPAYGIEPIVRGYGSAIGHSVEAHFPAGLALAALTLRHQRLPPAQDGCEVEKPCNGPLERVMVTCGGHWRGEGLALVEAAT